MSGVEESLTSLPFLSLEPLVSSVFPPGREKVSVPSPPYEELVEKRGDGFRNGRGRR